MESCEPEAQHLPPASEDKHMTDRSYRCVEGSTIHVNFFIPCPLWSDGSGSRLESLSWFSLLEQLLHLKTNKGNHFMLNG